MLELNKIYNQDCLEGMKQIDDKSIDMILCDLPYGTTKCKWDTIIPSELLWEQYERIIKDDGAIVLTSSQPFTSALIMSNPKLFKYCWYWEKNKCGNFMTAKYKPLKFIEDIVVFGFGAVNTKGGKGGGKTTRPFMKYNPQGVIYKSDTIIRKKPLPTDGLNRWNKLSNETFKSNGSNYPKDKLSFDAVSNKDRLHPTQKPVELFEYLINTYTNENDVVLDNCMGSGTTAIASINTNRQYIGFEMDNTYYDLSCERVENHKLVTL